MRSTGHEEQDYYTSIDGNPLKNPTAYCTHYHGYLSERLIKVHRCRKKHGGACARLQNMKGDNVRRMNQTQFYDRMVDRLDKMIVAMNKLSRSLEAISKSIDTKNEYPVYTVTGALKSIDMTHLEAKDSSDQYGNVTINE